MAFKDLDEFFDPNLYLTIRGKVYCIKSPNADEGLRLRKLFTDPESTYDDDDEIVEYQKLLGPVWEEMKADGIDWRSLCHAGRTALVFYGLSPSLAEVSWQTAMSSSGNKLPVEPNRQARRAKQRKRRNKGRTGNTTQTRKPTDATTPAEDHTIQKQDSATGGIPTPKEVANRS